jgi:hypothetical protein
MKMNGMHLERSDGSFVLGGDQDPASASLPPTAPALTKTILPLFSNKEVAIKVGTKFKVDLER